MPFRLGRFGAPAAIASLNPPYAVVGDVVFKSGKAFFNWLAGNGLPAVQPPAWLRADTAGTFFQFEGWAFSVPFYAPPDESVVLGAQAMWQRLTDLIELNAPSAASAQERLDRLRGQLEANIGQAEDIVSRGGYGPAMNGPTVQLLNAYNAINIALLSFSRESWPEAFVEIEQAEKQVVADRDAQIAADARRAAEQAAAEALRTRTAEATQRARDLLAQAQGAQQRAQQSAQAAGGASPLLWGGLAVLVIGGAFFALRRRSSGKVAGYRRRRR